jgi:hypothetical protein
MLVDQSTVYLLELHFARKLWEVKGFLQIMLLCVVVTENNEMSCARTLLPTARHWFLAFYLKDISRCCLNFDQNGRWLESQLSFSLGFGCSLGCLDGHVAITMFISLRCVYQRFVHLSPACLILCLRSGVMEVQWYCGGTASNTIFSFESIWVLMQVTLVYYVRFLMKVQSSVIIELLPSSSLNPLLSVSLW